MSRAGQSVAALRHRIRFMPVCESPFGSCTQTPALDRSGSSLLKPLTSPLQMRFIRIENCCIGDAAFALLAASARLPQLASLDITCIGLKRGGLRPLHGSPLLARLN